MPEADASYTLDAQALTIPFRTGFRHASAERRQTAAVWVRVRAIDGRVGYGEGCPREYVTGETVAGALRFIRSHSAQIQARIGDIDALRQWVGQQRELIDMHPAAWCAVELSLLDMFARQRAESVEMMLGLPRLTGPFRYSAVLGDADQVSFMQQSERYLSLGIRDFKVKLSRDSERDRERIQSLVAAAPDGIRLRVDANNLWQTSAEAVRHLRGLDVSLFAVEEPLPVGDMRGCAELAAALDLPIILDESFLRLKQIDALTEHPARWILNLRVSKLGGLLRSLEVLEAAQAAGLMVIVGAQVGETGLLTRAALTLAQAAGTSLTAQEGAFGTYLLTEDTCAPALMFGDGGLLDAAQVAQLPGFGLIPSAMYA